MHISHPAHCSKHIMCFPVDSVNSVAYQSGLLKEQHN